MLMPDVHADAGHPHGIILKLMFRNEFALHIAALEAVTAVVPHFVDHGLVPDQRRGRRTRWPSLDDWLCVHLVFTSALVSFHRLNARPVTASHGRELDIVAQAVLPERLFDIWKTLPQTVLCANDNQSDDVRASSVVRRSDKPKERAGEA